jgi:hypothetical protein
MARNYENEAEIEAVVRGFESCTTADTDFNHREHLTVTVWYLRNSSVEQTIGKMRDGLRRFLDHHQVAPENYNYNETLTVFWVRMVASFLNKVRTQSFLSQTNQILIGLQNSKLAFEYYSKELLASEEAKHGWVEPDLKPIEPRQE